MKAIPPNSTKKVRFRCDENDNMSESLICFIPRTSEMTEAEKDIIWWNEIDFTTFRANIKDSIADIRKNKRILKSFQNAIKASASKNKKHSYWKNTFVENESIVISSGIAKVSPSLLLDETTGSSHFNDLIEWIGGSPPRRGLESLVSPGYASERENMIKEHAQSVLRIAKKHRSSDAQSNEIHNKNATELRYQSEKSSITFKNFAFALGAADAVVVKAGSLSTIKKKDGRKLAIKKKMGLALRFKSRKVRAKE